MIKAFSRAIAQLRDPKLSRIFWIGVIGSVLVFTVLWGGIAIFLASTDYLHFSIVGFPINLDFISDLFGNLAAGVLTWLLFPSVITVIASLFLEDVAAAVEDRYYLGLPSPRKQPIPEILGITIKFTLIGIVLNILALPLILVLFFFPPFNLFVFYGLNGYLLGREYFELVGHRRLDPKSARRVRRRFRAQVFVAGVLIVILMTMPIVNLVAPIVATAAMVHLLHGWRERLGSVDRNYSLEIRD